MAVITNMINSEHFQKFKAFELVSCHNKGLCTALLCALWISNSDEKPDHIYISIHKTKLPFPIPRTPNLNHNTDLPFEIEKQIASKKSIPAEN